jgi:SAM-dependent methyltransferase/uncharacterized protein YbaR (Trm112 family)
MDEQITRLLACPLCRNPLLLNCVERDTTGIREGNMVCTGCGREYEITEGVFDLRPGIRIREEDGKQRWDLDACEQGYASLGAYKSSQDWARIRGVPVEVVDFLHRYVKGQLLEWVDSGSIDTVVDVGCGVGHFLLDLRSQRADPETIFVGMDVVFPRVLALRKRCEEEGITNVLCVAGDSERLPFAFEAVDHITCSEVLEHVFHPDRAMAEMCRILKPSGLLLISTPSGDGVRNWEYLVKPIRWLRNTIAKPKAQKADLPYDVPIAIDELRKCLADNKLNVMNFAIQPILPCEHFFKQIPPGPARFTVFVFGLINRYFPFLRNQLGLHAVIRSRKGSPVAGPAVP